MHRTRSHIIAVAALSIATVTASPAFTLPAHAAGRTATFCHDVASVGVVLSPSLPSSDSLSAIAAAVAKLPDDVTALKKIHAKLLIAATDAPSTALAGVVRDAATSVAKESGALTTVISAEDAVVADPKSSSAILNLARDLITATSAAATANAYLGVDRPMITEVCKSAA